MSVRPVIAVLGAALVLAGCGPDRTEAPAAEPATATSAVPATATASPDPSEASMPPSATPSDVLARARQLALAEQQPTAEVADLAELEEVLGACDGGLQHAVIITAYAEDPEALRTLTADYARRWEAAGWSPREAVEGGEASVTAHTDDGVELRWTVAADAEQSVGTLGAIGPCTPVADLPPQPSLAQAVALLEPLAIRAIELLVPAEEWGSDTAELACGDQAQRSTLTLQGPTDADPIAGLEAAVDALPGQVTRLARRTVLADHGDGQVLVLSTRPGEASVRAQTPCLPGG